MGDSNRVAKRREYEKETISLMVSMFCAGNHESAAKDCVSYCGKPICASCADLDAQAVRRTEKCPHMETKTSCARCPHPCYGSDTREAIRRVMRYAGPLMLLSHPLRALRHALSL